MQNQDKSAIFWTLESGSEESDNEKECKRFCELSAKAVNSFKGIILKKTKELIAENVAVSSCKEI